MRGFLERPLVHLVAIAALGIIAYSNTLEVPFQPDGKILIAKNPLVKDLGYVAGPSRGRDLPEYGLFWRRYTTFSTFALNYRLNGLDVRGYHVFNIALHILNAFLVYLFVLLTLKAPNPGVSRPGGRAEGIALLAGVLFVAHPLQTEAVTYICQRMAALSAFFYLLSMVLYARFRRMRGPGSLLCYALLVGSIALAVKTKENTLTLPFAILLYEASFFHGPWKRRAIHVLPLFLPLALYPLALLDIGLPLGTGVFGSDREAAELVSMGAFEGDYLNPSERRWGYLLTAPGVVLTYLRLLLFPINQNFDYDYPVHESLFHPHVLLPLVFHVSLLGLAVYLHLLSRRGRFELRAISFGILWFYLTLSVESSVVPLPLYITDYRVYLPGVGALLAVISCGALLPPPGGAWRGKARAAMIFLSLSLSLSLAVATYARNEVWRTNLSLWEDVVRKSPGKSRGHNNLGMAYASEGRLDEAIKQYRHTLALTPEHLEAYNNLGIAYKAKGLIDKAIQQYRIALTIKPDSAETHSNIGNAYMVKGLPEKAIEHYRDALKLKPDIAEAHINLGIAYLEKGLLDEARVEFQTVLRIHPGQHKARAYLNRIEKIRPR
jgi:tetratricopeptide (TPR) repeat protein